jgi:DinB superfamily
MADTDLLRKELIRLIDGVDAHMPFDAAVADFPEDAINRRPPSVDYTPYHLVWHLKFTQTDILDYIRNRTYIESDWPEAYWPDRDATATPAEFERTVAEFKADRAALRDIVADPKTDLLATIPDTPGHTILREIRVVGDHNAYHVGEFAILRQIMGTWPPDRRQ